MQRPQAESSVQALYTCPQELLSQVLVASIQAQENLREERRSGMALQQQVAQLEESRQASAQAVTRLEAQAKQLATQLQTSQATSHTLQKLMQVPHPLFG